MQTVSLDLPARTSIYLELLVESDPYDAPRTIKYFLVFPLYEIIRYKSTRSSVFDLFKFSCYVSILKKYLNCRSIGLFRSVCWIGFHKEFRGKKQRSVRSMLPVRECIRIDLGTYLCNRIRRCYGTLVAYFANKKTLPMENGFVDSSVTNFEFYSMDKNLTSAEHV